MRVYPVFAAAILFIGGSALASDAGWYLSPSLMSAQFEVGTAPTPGMRGGQAVFLKGSSKDVRMWRMPLGRSVNLDAWRQKRMRVTLRLKNDGDARAFTSLRINNVNETGLVATAQRNETATGVWEVHQFVLDVPANASTLLVNVGLTGKGTVWVDDLRLEAVGTDVPVTTSAPTTAPMLSLDRPA